jgi:hypothetical protein
MKSITVTACNPVGCLDTSETILIEEKISWPTLNCNSTFTNIYVGEVVRFYGSVAKGSHVSYDFLVEPGKQSLNILDSGVSILNQTQDSIVVVFTKSDTYSLTMVAFNHISEVYTVRSVYVKQLLCPPPAIRVVGGHDRLALKSRDTTLEMVVETCVEYFVRHQWTVYAAYPCFMVDLDPSIEPIELPKEITTTSPTLVFPARTLDYGSYCIRFRSEYLTTPASTTVQVRLIIVSSPLVPIISGGDERTVMKGETIIADGTLSYDPDLPKNAEQDLTYQWQCFPVVSAVIAKIVFIKA